MKKQIRNLFLLMLISTLFLSNSKLQAQQNVGIGTNTPATSAILDLTASNKGMLTPRMTSIQRIAIPAPATGLLVYDTDFDQFWYFDGVVWLPITGISGVTGPTGPAGQIGPAGQTGPAGAAGATGPSGIAGIQGPTGPSGTNGINGVTGPTGNDGIAGPTGLPGPTGPSGVASNAWDLLGNSGTIDGTNFLGTTDNIPFTLRVNNQRSGRIDHILGNTFFGYRAGLSTTVASLSTFFGFEAGLNANGIGAGGGNNVFIGYQTGRVNTSGFNNVFVGYLAGTANTGGVSNTFVGYAAGSSVTTGMGNSLFGSSFPGGGNGDIVTGNYNSRFGYGTNWFSGNQTGSCYFGYNAGANFSTGNHNTCMGRDSGPTGPGGGAGSNNTFLGYLANCATNSLSNSTAIGYNATVTLSNALVLGGIGANMVKVGIGISSPLYKLHLYGTSNNAADVYSETDAGRIIKHWFANATVSWSIGQFGTTFSPWGQFRITNETSGLACMAINTTGNIGIGTVSPNTSAILDITSVNTGLLIPRVALTQTTSNLPVGAGVATSLLIYNTATVNDVSPGFYYWDGAVWARISTGSGGGNDWTLLGNGGTIDSANFIGTTDNVPFNIRVNNQKAGRITSAGITFFGFQAGDANTGGIYNTAIGYQTLYSNTTGNYNTAIGGRHALFSNTTGSNNTAVGVQTLHDNTTGNYNVAIGENALYFNTTGSENTAVGLQTLNFSTIGNQNTATGRYALYTNTTGSTNTANGYRALYSNTTGSGNVAIGYLAANQNSTGNWNICIGRQAGQNNTVGGNVFIGDLAGQLNTTGAYNVCIGMWSGNNMTTATATANTFVGYMSGWSNTTAGGNSFFGNNAGINTNTGNYNTYLGAQAGQNYTSAANNTYIGYRAGFYTVGSATGGNNTFLGFQAGDANQAGTGNICIGYDADVSGSALTNATALGNTSVVNASDKVRLGNATVTVVEGQVAYTFPSDGRFKNNVTEDVKGLDFINRLRPVVYNFDTRKFDAFLMQNMSDSLRNAIMEEKDYSESSAIRQSGFIAQEVEVAARESSYVFNGVHKPVNENDNYSLAYSLFTVPLVEAVQELSKTNDNQQKLIDQLQNEIQSQKSVNTDLQKQINDLKALIK